MSSSSLGFRHTQTYVNPVITRQLNIEQPQPTEDNVPSHKWPKLRYGMKLLRLLMFVAVFSIGVSAYADPTWAVEAITTISVSEQESQLNDITNLLVPLLTGLNMSVPAVDTLIFSDVINVFVKVFASLILVACGGIPSKDDMFSRLLVIASQCTAFGTFLETAIDDDGVVLEQWFVIVFSTFACGLPTLVVGAEAYVEGRRLIS